MTVSLYDQSGHPLRTAVWSEVFVDTSSEFRAIMESLTLGDGTKVPAVVTMTGAKLAPGAAPDDLWVAQFTAAHGRPPTDQDRADRAWSLGVAAQVGRPPTDADWAGHFTQIQR